MCRCMKSTNSQEAPKLVTFKECNDWEGETWYFYIPLTQENREHIVDIQEAFKKYALLQDAYSIDMRLLTEEEVDRRCKGPQATDYMNQHNKVKKVMKTDDFKTLLEDTIRSKVYKGGWFEVEK